MACPPPEVDWSSWATWSCLREDIAPIATFVGAAIVALAALAQARTARRRHQEQTAADRERRITESFAKAVEQLGSDKLETRLGGIYTLERISRESKREYWPIMETLTAYVREHSPWPPRQTLSNPFVQFQDGRTFELAEESPSSDIPAKPEKKAKPSRESERVQPATDVQAILTVLGRREEGMRGGEHLNLSATDLRCADLSGAHLERANLREAHLEGANLSAAHLEGANLFLAHLEGADLFEAHLEGATLMAAHLEGATLMAAHLEGADLFQAHLEGADLFEAHLEGADLSGAHLEGATLSAAHLERANLREAHLEGATLRAAHLEGATLRAAHLERANLREAHLEGANLREAHLEGADLSAAHLEQEALKILDAQTLMHSNHKD